MSEPDLWLLSVERSETRKSEPLRRAKPNLASSLLQSLSARFLLLKSKDMKQNLIAISFCTLITCFVLAQQTQTLEVKIGERVKLAKLGGPNVELIINGVDQFDISVTAIDYENMRFVRTNGQYGYQQPGITTRQIKKADRGHTRIFHRADCTVYYVPDMATGMNHAKLEVKIGG